MPFGANLTVSETGADGYTMSLTYLGNAASNPIDINDIAATPQNIVVTNTKNVTPDTGIEDTAGPMMTMAVFCIVALCAAGTAVAVREKRRRTAR